MEIARIDRGRAAQRLGQDGETPVPLIELVEEGGPSVDSMKRWIKRGKGGCRLDAMEDDDRGWLTTRKAIQRFLAQAAKKKRTSHKPQPANPPQVR